MSNITLEKLHFKQEINDVDDFIGGADVQVRNPLAEKGDAFIVASVGFEGTVRPFGGVGVADIKVGSAITTHDDDKKPSYETAYSFSPEDKALTCKAIERCIRAKIKYQIESDIEQVVIDTISERWAETGKSPISLSFDVESSTARIDFITEYGDIVKLLLACSMEDSHYNIMATGSEAASTINIMMSEMVLTKVLVINKECETIEYDASGFSDLQAFTRNLIESVNNERFTEENRGRVVREVIIFEDGELNRKIINPLVNPDDEVDAYEVDAKEVATNTDEVPQKIGEIDLPASYYEGMPTQDIDDVAVQDDGYVPHQEQAQETGYQDTAVGDRANMEVERIAAMEERNNSVDTPWDGGTIKDDSNDRFDNYHPISFSDGANNKFHSNASSLVDAVLGDMSRSDADINDIQIVRSRIDSGILTGLRVSRLVLVNSHLYNLELVGAEIKKSRVYGGGLHNATLTGASIISTTLDGCQLVGVDKSNTNIISTDYHKCDLTGASFEGAKLIAVTFKDLDLLNANFDNATLIDCLFIDCNLLGSSFNKATLISCNTDAPCFNLADLSQAICLKK